MTMQSAIDVHGVLTAPETLTVQRLMPGPVDRLWAYLIDGEKRRRWLAAGAMTPEVGAAFEFVWRNDELTDPPGQRPEGSGGEHRMQGRITAVEPLRRLAFTWFDEGEVVIDLEPKGDKVLLTLTHTGLSRRSARLSVSTGWHAHLDVLDAELSGRAKTPFWDAVRTLRAEYERRQPE
jgi:uncharacterized protein YndB with AHSA1/START domain